MSVCVRMHCSEEERHNERRDTSTASSQTSLKAVDPTESSVYMHSSDGASEVNDPVKQKQRCR